MTILVSIEQEEGGHVMRRWAKNAKTEGRLVLTHEGAVEGWLYSHTVHDFCEKPPAGTRVGYESDYERSWEPSSAA